MIGGVPLADAVHDSDMVVLVGVEGIRPVGAAGKALAVGAVTVPDVLEPAVLLAMTRKS